MCVCVCVFVSHSVVSDSLLPHGLEPTWLLCLWDSPGKTTGVGCHFLLLFEYFPLFLDFFLIFLIKLLLFFLIFGTRGRPRKFKLLYKQESCGEHEEVGGYPSKASQGPSQFQYFIHSLGIQALIYQLATICLEYTRC